MKDLALNAGGYQINPPRDLAGLSGLNLQSLIHWGINLALPLAALLAFIFVVVGGFKWMISQGDKKQLDEAKKTLTYAIVGLILIFLSFFIINIIYYALCGSTGCTP